MLLLNSGRFGGGFSPLDIPNLEAWWDAQDTGTISGTASAVTQWNDKSGNGYHLAPVGTGNEPAQLTVGGENMISFDSTNDENLAVASTAINPVSASFTMVAVWRANNALGDQIIFGRGDSGPRYDLFFNGSTGDLSGGINDNINRFKTLTDTTINYDDNVVRISAIMLDQSADDFFLFGNDDVTALQSDLSTLTTPVNPTAASHDFFLSGFDSGPGSANWAPMTGEIGEVIIYHQELSAAQREDLWDYLKAKWSI
jgi:hypothetical protein